MGKGTKRRMYQHFDSVRKGKIPNHKNYDLIKFNTTNCKMAPTSMVTDLIQSHAQLPLLTVKEADSCEEVTSIMQKYSVSQLPVKNDSGDFVGAVEDANLYAELLKNRDLMKQPVSVIMGKPYPIVSHTDTIEKISTKINKSNAAVLMMDMGGNWHIITKQDLIQAIAKGNS